MVNQSLALRKARPLEITPLSAPIAGLSRSLADASAVSETRSRPARDGRPTLTGGEVRGLLAAPGKIREVVLLTEILQPPVALRRARRVP
jgi:hypothetical protein